MIWQDLVFLCGSALSIVFLAPTLRDASARVPLGTSLPSMGIGGVYAFTFASLGMTFSAAGAAAAGGMWSLIAFYRSPDSRSPTLTRRDRVALFVADGRRWAKYRLTGPAYLEQYRDVGVDVTQSSRHGSLARSQSQSHSRVRSQASYGARQTIDHAPTAD